ncbi:hypothetical protein GGTG_14410 [Gaeumannomyces tritici R3-111a-1]|uniref:Uncharacterized protein n=1 Tax=Gaeumannomyces tritici (strain R3-111a-1) TaxID=644352 RepID=J3PLE3_GAET3|nr:hypothetical protein GGTG_14410 [Gaeumannomyces tritici R3-111a-1]EJT68012.1 hypothetical protein GGTG_14410 [Gaeumannomyces tritici R3-111a-1]
MEEQGRRGYWAVFRSLAESLGPPAAAALVPMTMDSTMRLGMADLKPESEPEPEPEEDRGGPTRKTVEEATRRTVEEDEEGAEEDPDVGGAGIMGGRLEAGGATFEGGAAGTLEATGAGTGAGAALGVGAGAGAASLAVGNEPAAQPTRPTKTSEFSLIRVFWEQKAVMQLTSSEAPVAWGCQSSLGVGRVEPPTVR